MVELTWTEPISFAKDSYNVDHKKCGLIDSLEIGLVAT